MPLSANASRAVVSALLLFVVAGCSGSPRPASEGVHAATAKDAGSQPGATPSTEAAPPDYCAMFTTEQISAVLGKPVKPGRAPGIASDGCEWDAASAPGIVFIRAMNAGLWNDLSGRPSQRPVQGVGQKAYIGPSSAGGVEAGAVAPCGQCPSLTVENAFYLIRVDPARADDTVIGLLRDFISRAAGR